MSKMPAELEQQKGESKTPVYVTTANGSFGIAVLKQLSKINSISIIAEIHQNKNRDTVLQELSPYVQQFVNLPNSGDNIDLKTVERLFIIPPNSRNRLQFVKAHLDAAKSAGVKFILLLSVTGTSSPGAPRMAQEFKDIEDLVEKSDIPCTFLRAGFFQENILRLAKNMLQNNTLQLPLDGGKIAPVSMVDVAKMSATILSNPDEYVYRAYDLVGPHLLSGSDISKLMSNAINKDIKFSNASLTNSIDIFRNCGWNFWQACDMAELLAFISSDAYEKLDTRPLYRKAIREDPTSLQDFFQRNISNLGKGGENDKKEKTKLFATPAMDKETRDTGQESILSSSSKESVMGGVGGMTTHKPDISEEFQKTDLTQLRFIVNQLIRDHESAVTEIEYFTEREETRLNHLRQLRLTIEKISNRLSNMTLPVPSSSDTFSKEGESGQGTMQDSQTLSHNKSPSSIPSLVESPSQTSGHGSKPEGNFQGDKKKVSQIEESSLF